MATIIVTALLILIVVLIIRSMIRDRKVGKTHCDGNCKHCSSGCHQIKKK